MVNRQGAPRFERPPGNRSSVHHVPWFAVEEGTGKVQRPPVPPSVGAIVPVTEWRRRNYMLRYTEHPSCSRAGRRRHSQEEPASACFRRRPSSGCSYRRHHAAAGLSALSLHRSGSRAVTLDTGDRVRRNASQVQTRHRVRPSAPWARHNRIIRAHDQRWRGTRGTRWHALVEVHPQRS